MSRDTGQGRRVVPGSESSDNFRIFIEFGSFIFIGYVSRILPGLVHMFFFIFFILKFFDRLLILFVYNRDFV